MRIDYKTRHLMTLIRKDANDDGWACVSDQLWPFLEALPVELVDRKETEMGGMVRLTDKGNTVLDWT